MNNPSFRQKLFVSYLLVFLAFLIFLFPFASESVRTIVRKTFKQRLLTLISQVSSASSTEDLIDHLKAQESFLFSRVTLFTSTREILYDSSSVDPQEFEDPEFVEALTGSTGYSEGYSPVLEQKLIYVIRAFDFQGKRLILRAAFPYKQVSGLIVDFEIGFIALGSAVLLIFAIMMWIIIHHLSRPIQTIINAIKPYQEGHSDTITKISLSGSQSEFYQLADTINSLSDRVQSHISTLTQERNSKEIILDSLGEGIIAINGSQEILFVNSIAAQLLQIDRYKLIGKKIEDLSQKNLLILSTRCLKEHQAIAGNLALKDQKKFLEILAVPITNADGAVLILKDKSSHYRIIEMGKDFVANASHELKTPITIIRGFAETLYEHPELPPTMTHDIITKIVKNCGRMEMLIKNLLTLADIEKLPLSKMYDFNLVTLVDNCKQMTQAIWNNAQITITCLTPELHLIADPDLLELAICNLLSNAAKYSKPPAIIRVHLSENNGSIFIAVTDQGIGIPPDDLENIFDRFYTVDKTHSRRLGGAGLGLAITKTIIDKHEGSINASSLLGAGSTFTIILPKRF
ncbi:MAG: ATP-binding protein [Chlamydiota bacterium]